MKNYIPDELFNLIEYPTTGTEESGIDGILQEIVYKIPNVSDLVAKKETWHAVCDFCGRTGALVDKISAEGSVIKVWSKYGEFMRVVGCYDGNGAKHDPYQWRSDTLDGKPLLDCGTDSLASAVASFRPHFDDARVLSGKWSPIVPKYLVSRYGECIMHGALMRIFVMTNEPWANVDLARMHATAYNNDMTRISYGLITSGMRKHMLVDVEDFLVQAKSDGNG